MHKHSRVHPYIYICIRCFFPDDFLNILYLYHSPHPHCPSGHIWKPICHYVSKIFKTCHFYLWWVRVSICIFKHLYFERIKLTYRSLDKQGFSSPFLLHSQEPAVWPREPYQIRDRILNAHIYKFSQLLCILTQRSVL